LDGEVDQPGDEARGESGRPQIEGDRFTGDEQ
jgi:hypothetical protein